MTEITSGDSITIICLKRPLQIHLVGIVAPDQEQPYADVARQHLSDLILNKQVVVEYSGLGVNALISGKVLLKEMDVSAQMIRDGVAWYDRPYDTILTPEQRQLYAACELAAQSEHRGIWQDHNPVPPWEFREARRAGQFSKVNPSVVVPPVARSNNPKSALTNENLSPSFASTSASLLGSSEGVKLSSDSRWIRFTHPSMKVSMLVPGDGIKRSSKVLLPDGRVVEVNSYMGRFEKTSYLLLSSTGPDAGESDTEMLDGAIKGFISGIQSDWLKLGSSFQCYPDLDRNFATSGYAARQYDLTGCTVPGRARLYTRVLNNIREVHFSAVFFFGSSDDPNARRFFESFLVSSTPGSKGR